MLRLIIIAALVYGVYLVGSSMMGKYDEAQRKSGGRPEHSVAPGPVATNLEGMPHQLQASLDTAASQGPGAMKRWLDANRKYCRDPKLGEIELDYAVALMRQNSAQAKAMYKSVKTRTPPNSPLQPRLQRLSRTFE